MAEDDRHSRVEAAMAKVGDGRGFLKRRCPECTGPNDFLEWRQTIDLGFNEFGDFVPPQNWWAHDFRCRRCGYDYRWETTRSHPDRKPDEFNSLFLEALRK